MLEVDLEKRIPDVRCFRLERHSDRRGSTLELFRVDDWQELKVCGFADNFSNLQMGYMSLTRHGVSRGPHEHKFQTDRFIFAGPGVFDIHLWDNRSGVKFPLETHLKLCAGLVNPLLIIVPPGVVHGYKNIGGELGLAINFPDQLYKGVDRKLEVDEIRWELDKDNPFKMQ